MQRLQTLPSDALTSICYHLDAESLFSFGACHPPFQEIAEDAARLCEMEEEWRKISLDLSSMLELMRAMRTTMSKEAAVCYAMRLRRRKRACLEKNVSIGYRCAKCFLPVEKIAECAQCQRERELSHRTLCTALAACVRRR